MLNILIIYHSRKIHKPKKRMVLCYEYKILKNESHKQGLPEFSEPLKIRFWKSRDTHTYTSVHKLINVSENVGFRVVKRQFLYSFLKGSFNKNTVSGNNRFVPVERLSILAVQLFQAELAELLSPAWL